MAHLAFAYPVPPAPRRDLSALKAQQARPRLSSAPRRRLPASCSAAKPSTQAPTTEETFAEDAGRDLFFTGMDADMAMAVLDAPLGGLDERDDRFIAAERIKFFESEEVTACALRFLAKFGEEGVDLMEDTILEDRVARRKAVESLGRFKGRFLKGQVLAVLEKHLADVDPLMVEVCIWSLGEIGVEGREGALREMARVLKENEGVSKRTVIQALMRAKWEGALEAVRPFVDDDDATVASAALAAVCVLGGDAGRDGMRKVVGALKSDVLGVRRSAMEDLTLAKEVSALANVVVAPNSLVLRARTARVFLEEMFKRGEGVGDEGLDAETALLIDRLIWDHPCDLDLLGIKKETKKARDAARNIRQLYKNDALFPYLSARTLAEDYHGDAEVGASVLKSFEDQPYFDYFGAYHIFKTLGWLNATVGTDLLLDNAENLPPRFFNHQVGAITALAELGEPRTMRVLEKVASETRVWELKYACLLSAERLGLDGGNLRAKLSNDDDWLIRARAQCPLGFEHLRSEFDWRVNS